LPTISELSFVKLQTRNITSENPSLTVTAVFFMEGLFFGDAEMSKFIRFTGW